MEDKVQMRGNIQDKGTGQLLALILDDKRFYIGTRQLTCWNPYLWCPDRSA